MGRARYVIVRCGPRGAAGGATPDPSNSALRTSTWTPMSWHSSTGHAARLDARRREAGIMLDKNSPDDHSLGEYQETQIDEARSRRHGIRRRVSSFCFFAPPARSSRCSYLPRAAIRRLLVAAVLVGLALLIVGLLSGGPPASCASPTRYRLRRLRRSPARPTFRHDDGLVAKPDVLRAIRAWPLSAIPSPVSCVAAGMMHAWSRWRQAPRRGGPPRSLPLRRPARRSLPPSRREGMRPAGRGHHRGEGPDRDAVTDP
jgi:hypothetical protein